ncbi:hypothetical protein [Mesobacillus maritimus]|uniref:hypothetical protein n=1 Tax=Mesobacillus maritimus TaxID=1643336 RepID=UPI00384B3494
MRSYLILGMCALFIIQYFAQVQWLQYVVFIMALLAFIGSAVNADRFPRLLGILMMTTGLIMEWSKGTGFGGVNQGIFLILPLICLITLAPLLSIPLKTGGYFEAVSSLLHRFLHQPRKLYAGMTGTLFFLSPILNLASVRILNEFIEELKLPSAMSAKGYLVGFTTALTWSPYFASVSLVLHYLNVPFSEYILYGLGLSIMLLVVGNLLFALWEKRNPIDYEASSGGTIDRQHQNRLVKLGLFVILLMSICLTIEKLTSWSMIVIVCLISVTVPVVNALKPVNRKKMRPLLIDFRDRTVPIMNNEITLFMSAGMLAFALQGTSFANKVSSLLTGLANESFFLFAGAVLLIVLSITYIGIHQIAVIGALAMQLKAEELGMTDISLVMLLLLTWVLSAALSPFSGLNLMISRFSGISGFRLGINTNGLHLSIIAIIGIAFISFIA